ncbi:HAD-IA family hydrolase [Saccharothrix sp. S26]|uniref:HAD-IA family hydrolase n=1 Tax=Saccharothrix sp. S26 TaxID=2907215 RepID=UPI001F1FDF44|nr:HAD-IA family hydrolase [Saccharothrix sp. S26]MCE6996347.1 HAD-IA family hydrolase [Saccharothrix sp. S26]
MQQISAIWTDFGGVLTPPVADDVAVFCARMGMTPEQFIAAEVAVGRRYGVDAMAPLDTPLITEDEWAAQVQQVLAEEHGVEVDLSDFGTKWFTDRSGNPEWEGWLRAHHGEVFIGLLSNMPPAWDAHWRRLVPPAGLFDELVMSFEVGCRKPSPEIFELAAGLAGAPPEECVLVDDLEKNCEGARAAGWQAVHFTKPSDAIDYITPRLVAPQVGVTGR